MKIDLKKHNKLIYGILPGLALPMFIMWIYLNRFYPLEISFIEAIKQLYPSPILGKLLLLSIMPNLGLVFIFYKSDSFKIAAGFMVSAMPYLITSIFML